jgi:hypothetical protein
VEEPVIVLRDAEESAAEVGWMMNGKKADWRNDYSEMANFLREVTPRK